jgi:hypothetical protein
LYRETGGLFPYLFYLLLDPPDDDLEVPLDERTELPDDLDPLFEGL